MSELRSWAVPGGTELVSTLPGRIAAAASDVVLILDADATVRRVVVNEPLPGGSDWDDLIGHAWADTLGEDSRRKALPLLEEARRGRTERGREVNQNNRAQAASLLAVSRQSLYAKLRQHH